MIMIILKAKIRKEIGKKVSKTRSGGLIPAVLYGPKIKEPLNLNLDYKEFEKIFKEAGESTLISLEVESKKFMVLVHDLQRDHMSSCFTHIDFYQPLLDHEIEVMVPVVFEGAAPAVKELGGTLVKNISELKVKALPQNLPHEIRVNIDGLKNFNDHIQIKDLNLPSTVKVLKALDEIIVLVSAPSKVEEELEKPIEEKVEEVEKIEKKKEKEESTETAEAPKEK